MEEKFVVVNLRSKFVFLVRLVVTAVEKAGAVFFPGRAGELDPVQHIRSIFAGLDVAHLPLLPIGTGAGQSVSQQFGVVAHINAAQGDGAVFGQNIWI